MDSARGVLPETTENPAAVADAEQHAREEMAEFRARAGARAAEYARPLAAAASAAGIVVSGWLIRRWRRMR
jgi:hypothetical protein